ncbi:DUF3383 family protein [Entomohabitans teleogrylli]|uniref:DUF3383 family protein n=1 Tax=Entomohabitans teleogrylli TaxID=1384589 RepID=UPI00073D87E5|nr:DUF3383 family protein [Entomohabitans teleogrylli]
MSIAIDHYVKITSGVGSVAHVRQRDLILRLFTPNKLTSPDSVLEFTSADGVGAYFGYDSEEYRRAVYYFGYISPSITTPAKLGFCRDQDETSPPMVLGQSTTWSVSELKTISGTLEGTIGGQTFTTASVDLSSVSSLADVASLATSALRALSDEALKTSTVDYDPLLARFRFTGGADADVVVKFTGGAVAQALALIGGESIAGVVTPLTEAESVAIADDISNNYGSFLFMRSLMLEQVVDLARANAAKNVQFMYLAGCTLSQAEEYNAALLPIGSVGVTLVDVLNTEFDEQIPGILMAATDYTRTNGAINYMYKQVANVTPKITTTSDAQKYDALRINYYGRTQNAGNIIDFYQRGSLMGGGAYPTAMNVHANEQWLKDTCASVLLSLQLALERIPANETGINLVLSALQDEPMSLALNNGVISRGKTLTMLQKNYITQITGDDTAWTTIQTAGYWLNAVVDSYITDSGETEYQIVYTLIYGKDDAIRKITGTHVLI